MSRIIFSLHGSAALLAGTASLLFLTGCVGDMPHRGSWVGGSHNKRVQMAYGIPTGPRLAVAPVPVRPIPVVVKPPTATPAKPKVIPAAPRRHARKH